MSDFDRHDVTVVVRPAGIALEVEEVTLTIDETWNPFAQGTIVAKMPDDRDILDLRANPIEIDLRMLRSFGEPWSLSDLTADIEGSVANLTTLLGGLSLATLTNRYFRPFVGSTVLGSERLYGRLVVRDREFDELTQQVTLSVASVESLLLGDRLASVTPINPGTTSLRAIAQQVLNRYGATLDASALDATVAEVDATIWKPGVSAADYLAPMLEAASLRLWADLEGTWYLDLRETLREGTVAVSESLNMTEYVDRMSLDSDDWFDAVIVEYRWTDALELQRIEYDVAGVQPSRAAQHFTREAVYPGPGAATGILERAQGRGRQLNIGAVSTYLARPGMAAIITPLVGAVSTGVISAVSWQLPKAEMNVTTRGLIDTPDNAYLFGPTGYSYLDVPIGVDYFDFEWSVI